ncbi:MAG: alpha/beta hydrolase [Bifidobacterium sp.]|uniref:alpha/beta fold hydrolase n=1 Tax=Bifidobacterium sp. TaxID=41200 RepID=UPI0039ECF865
MFVHKIGEGLPLVMLHGFPLDHRSLLPFEDFLADKGQWQRYYIDLPGLGAKGADTEIRGAQDVLEKLVEYLDREFHGRQFAVVGYSFGCLLASALAARYGSQIIGLFLLAPETIAVQEKRSLATKAAYQVSELPGTATKDEREAYETTAIVHSAESFEAFRRYVYPGLAINADNPNVQAVMEHPSLAHAPESYLREYREPVTIVTAQHDTMVGYRDAFYLYETLHEGTYACIPRAGHNIHLEQPGMVGMLFQSWLKGIEKH